MGRIVSFLDQICSRQADVARPSPSRSLLNDNSIDSQVSQGRSMTTRSLGQPASVAEAA